MEKKENVYNRIFMAPIKTYKRIISADASAMGYLHVLIQVILGVLGLKLLNIQIDSGI